MQIYVSGSVAYDRIMNFPGKFKDHILPDQTHNLNVAFMVDRLIEKFGGTAGNIAYSLMLLGENPLILASAGDDFDRYEARLRKYRLSTRGIRHIDGTLTPGAYIITDRSNNQITAFNPGAMQYPSNFEFDQPDIANALAIVAPGNLDDMSRYSRFYKGKGIGYIFDPGQSIPALTGEALTAMIAGCRYLISNDYELEMIKKATGMQDETFLRHCEAVITTLGENGSIIRTTQQEIAIAAVTLEKVVDPTGAGDAFRAGLIKGLIENRSLADAARMGSVCASYAVEKEGTQAHTFSMDDFTSRYQQTFE